MIWTDEDWFRRPAPLAPYNLPDCKLLLPQTCLDLSLATFEDCRKLRQEAACFWYGTRDQAGNGVVEALVVPAQSNRRGNYHVSAEAMGEVASRTRPLGWKNLAQVHTHPGSNVEHSRYDDENASSRRALSVVFPFYGNWGLSWPTGVGVHECQDGYWHLLPAAEASMRVVITATSTIELMDLR